MCFLSLLLLLLFRKLLPWQKMKDLHFILFHFDAKVGKYIISLTTGQVKVMTGQGNFYVVFEKHYILQLSRLLKCKYDTQVYAIINFNPLSIFVHFIGRRGDMKMHWSYKIKFLKLHFIVCHNNCQLYILLVG